jgi:hypothetical protein
VLRAVRRSLIDERRTATERTGTATEDANVSQTAATGTPAFEGQGTVAGGLDQGQDAISALISR